MITLQQVVTATNLVFPRKFHHSEVSQMALLPSELVAFSMLHLNS